MPQAGSQLHVAGRLLVYAHSLANLALRGQGWYAVQVRPVGGSHGIICGAHVIDNGAPSFMKDHPNPALNAAKGKFRFKVCKICYAKEQASINQALVLQLLYPAHLDFTAASCTLQFELLCSTADITSDDAPHASTFKCLAKQRFKLDGVLAGCHAYTAVTFGKGHAALCNVGLHATALGYVVQQAGGLSRPAKVINPADQGTPDAEVLPALEAAMAAGSSQHTHAGDSDHQHFGAPYSHFSGQVINAQQALAQFLASLPREGLPVSKLESMRSMASQLAAAKQGKQTDPNASSAALFAAAAAAAAKAASTPAVAPAVAAPAAEPAAETIKAAGESLHFCNDGPAASSHADLEAVLLEMPGGSQSDTISVLPVIAEVQLADHQKQKQEDVQHDQGQQEQQGQQELEKQEQPGAPLGTAEHVLAAWKLHSPLLALDWAVLEWCLRMTGPAILHHLRVQWEGRQAQELSPWVLCRLAGASADCFNSQQTVFSHSTEGQAMTSAAVAHRAIGSCANAGASSTAGSNVSSAICSSIGDSREQASGAMAGTASTSAHSSANPRHCRKLLRQRSGRNLPRVYDPTWWRRPHHNPLLFVDDALAQHPDYIGPAITPQSKGLLNTTGIHVVVFVHGFQGHATDLALVQANMLLLDPSLKCLCSTANEKCTLDSIGTMGQRLAAEVAEFVQPYANSIFKPLVRLSFVAHSMGNLVVRAALTEAALQPFVPKLWMMLSLSGPHLGLLYSGNRLVGSALRLVKKLPAIASGGRSVLEMTFSDAKDMRDCYLFKLAQQPVLQLFKHVVLVASPQDKYVGHQSAKIQPCRAAERDTKRWPLYQDMMQSLLTGMGAPGATQLLRVDVDFCFARDYTVGSLVGRTAHVEFVDGDSYVQPLVWGVLQQRGVLQAVPGAWVGDC